MTYSNLWCHKSHFRLEYMHKKPVLLHEKARAGFELGTKKRNQLFQGAKPTGPQGNLIFLNSKLYSNNSEGSSEGCVIITQCHAK